MGEYFQHTLNRETVDKLLRKQQGLFSSFSRKRCQVEPTIQECEISIVPLLDYLERNLKVLNTYLSESNMQFVVSRIWKEILITLENVLLPPLSEELSVYRPLSSHEVNVIFKWLEVLLLIYLFID